MSGPAVWLIDLPLALLACAWWWPCRGPRPASERLERLMASVLLAAAAIVLAEALAGPAWLLAEGLGHGLLALLLAGVPGVIGRRPGPRPGRLPLARLAAYAGGLALSGGLAAAGSFGQYALSA